MSNIYKRSGIDDKKIKLTQESFKNTNDKWLDGQVNGLDNVVSVDIVDEAKPISEPTAVVEPKEETVGINLFTSGIFAVDTNADLFSFVDDNLSLKYIKVRALKIKPDMIKNLDKNYSGKLVAFDVKTDIPSEEPVKEEEKQEEPVAVEAGTVESEPIEFPPLGSIAKEEPKVDEVVVPEFNDTALNEKTEIPVEEPEIKEEEKIDDAEVEEYREEERGFDEAPTIHYSENNIPAGRLFVDEDKPEEYKEEPIVAPEREEEPVEEPIMKEEFSIPVEEHTEEEKVETKTESDDLVASDYLESLRKLRDEADSLKAKAAETSENAEKAKEDAKNKAEIIKSLVEKETEKIKKEMEETQQIIDKNEEEIAKSEKEIENYTKTQNELETILGVKAE